MAALAAELQPHVGLARLAALLLAGGRLAAGLLATAPLAAGLLATASPGTAALHLLLVPAGLLTARSSAALL